MLASHYSIFGCAKEETKLAIINVILIALRILQNNKYLYNNYKNLTLKAIYNWSTKFLTVKNKVHTPIVNKIHNTCIQQLFSIHVLIHIKFYKSIIEFKKKGLKLILQIFQQKLSDIF